MTAFSNSCSKAKNDAIFNYPIRSSTCFCGSRVKMTNASRVKTSRCTTCSFPHSSAFFQKKVHDCTVSRESDIRATRFQPYELQCTTDGGQFAWVTEQPEVKTRTSWSTAPKSPSSCYHVGNQLVRSSVYELTTRSIWATAQPNELVAQLSFVLRMRLKHTHTHTLNTAL